MSCRTGWTTRMCSLSMVAVSLVYGMFIIAIPFAVLELKQNASHVLRWTSISSVVHAATSILVSRVATQCQSSASSRLMAIMGVLMLGTAAIMSLGHNVMSIVASRLVGGSGRSIICVALSSMLPSNRDGSYVNRGLRYWGILIRGATSLGIISGGVILHTTSFKSVVVSAIVCLSVLLCGWVMPSKRNSIEKSTTVNGTYWFSSFGSNGTPKLIAAPATLSLLETTISGGYEGRSHTTSGTEPQDGCQPASIRKLTNGKQLKIAMAGYVVIYMTRCIVELTLPVYVQENFDWTALQGGVALFVVTAPICATFVVGRIESKVRVKCFTCVGFLATCTMSVVLQIFLCRELTQFTQLAIPVIGLGASSAVAELGCFAEILSILDLQDDLLCGDENILYILDLSMFSAMLGELIGALMTTAGSLEHINTVVILMGVVSGIMFIPTAIFTGGFVFERALQQLLEGLFAVFE